MEALHLRLGAALCGFAALAFVAPAAATGETLTVPEPVSRECAAALVPGSPGIVTRTLAAPDRSILTARLSGDDRSDWDLAVFTPSGAPVAASTAFGSDESAAALATAGQALTVQACRLDGRTATAGARDRVRPASPRTRCERADLAGVGGRSPGRPTSSALERLGVDVTHDVSPDSATVVLYSAAERALLDSAGFETSPLIADLRGGRRRDRAAEIERGPGAAARPAERPRHLSPVRRLHDRAEGARRREPRAWCAR